MVLGKEAQSGTVRPGKESTISLDNNEFLSCGRQT